MKLQDQVTSLELSKKLNKLFPKGNTLFSWTEFREFEYELVYRDDLENLRKEGEHDITDVIPAYTVAELGEMLPEYLLRGTGAPLIMRKWAVKYHVEYHRVFEAQLVKTISDGNEANARAKMLIYLAENNLNPKEL